MDEPISEIEAERMRPNYIESVKLAHDTFKHITTLSTGSILLLVTLVAQLFINPVAIELLIVSFAGFIVATMGAVGVMLTATISLQGVPRELQSQAAHRSRLLSILRSTFESDFAIRNILGMVCFTSFFLAIVSLVVFTALNLYQR